MNDADLDADEAEIARIMCRIPEFAWMDGAEFSKIRHEIRRKVARALQEYYLENTRGHNTDWTARFRECGISDDEGKSAISCARRLGIEIS